MRVLAFDTSTPRGSIALLEDRETCAELHLHSLETHSARLLASTEFLLKMSGWNLSDLGLIVAGIGPGSFTGIRIGVATALGLAQTCALPFAGISGLDALAQKFAGVDGHIGVVMDAQRSQVYFAEYAGRHGKIARAGKPSLLKPEELAARLSGKRILLLGDGALRYREVLTGSRGGARLMELDLFLAGAMGRLALARKRAWRSGAYLVSEPIYIRPPDAFKGQAEVRLEIPAIQILPLTPADIPNLEPLEAVTHLSFWGEVHYTRFLDQEEYFGCKAIVTDGDSTRMVGFFWRDRSSRISNCSKSASTPSTRMPESAPGC